MSPLHKTPLQMSDIRTRRWTKAGNGRLLPLNHAAWKKLRAKVLSGEPLCRHCTARGLTVPATDVDHRDNNPANNELVNMQPLCHECHSRKTNRDMGHNVAYGCDTSGKPLDPAHHWNKPACGDLVRSAGAMSEESPATEPYIPPRFPYLHANRETVA